MHVRTTMYIQNRQSSRFNGCSPLQNYNSLISLKPAIAHICIYSTLATSGKDSRPDRYNSDN